MLYLVSSWRRLVWRISYHMRAIKVLSPVAWLLDHLLLRNVEIYLRYGETIRADLCHKQWARVAQRGYHELGTQRFLNEFLRPGDVVIDVGASVGLVTVVAAKCVQPNGRVYAIEPDPFKHRDLHRAIQRNKLHNVIVETVAMGEASGTAKFIRPEGAWGSFQVSEEWRGEIAPPSDLLPHIWRTQFGHGTVSRFDVQMITLDNFVEDHRLKDVHLVKVDVDGPEPIILKGMRRLLASDNPPALVVETSQFNRAYGSSFEEIFALLTGLGYQLHGGLRMEEHVVRLDKASDLYERLSITPTSAANLFCCVPAVHQQRWETLWLSRGL